MKGLASRVRSTALLCLAAVLLASEATAAATWPRAAAQAAPDSALEARIRSIVAGMTLEQKVGQMT